MRGGRVQGKLLDPATARPSPSPSPGCWVRPLEQVCHWPLKPSRRWSRWPLPTLWWRGGSGEGCVHVPEPPAPYSLPGLERRVRGYTETPRPSQQAGPSGPSLCMTPALMSVSVHLSRVSTRDSALVQLPGPRGRTCDFWAAGSIEIYGPTSLNRVGWEGRTPLSSQVWFTTASRGLRRKPESSRLDTLN